MSHFLLEDTIVAPATVPGTGAISVIRISGSKALDIVDQVVRFKSGNASNTEGYRIKYGTVADSSGEVLDEVLTAVFRAPRSYTGEDMAEISCHASGYIVSQLTERLLDAGARMAEPGEFTRRAFVNGKMDLSQAEAVADVIAAENRAAHRVAMNQLRGGYSRELAGLREELLEMASLLELELDFSEEDVEFADRSRLAALLGRVTGHVDSLIGSFRLGNALRSGVPVAIVGPVNAGKSTLLNTLLQDDRAIVSDVAGTTRDTVEETLNIDGILFRFIDTAGLRETEETVEQAGIRRSLQKLSEAEIVLCVLDAGAPPEALAEDLRSLLGKVDPTQQTVFILPNKTDTWGINKNVTIFNNIVSIIDKYGFIVKCDWAAPVLGADGCEGDSGAVFGCIEACPEAGTSHSAAFSGATQAYADAVTDYFVRRGTERSEAENGASGVEIVAEAAVGEKFRSSESARADEATCIDRTAERHSSTPGPNVVPAKIQKAACYYIEISAKEGRHIDELKRRLVESRKDLMSHVEGSLVTNARHLDALRTARTSLSRVRDGLETGLPTDLVARDLRDTIDALGSILGDTIDADTVLGNVFRNFCIGK